MLTAAIAKQLTISALQGAPIQAIQQRVLGEVECAARRGETSVVLERVLELVPRLTPTPVQLEDVKVRLEQAGYSVIVQMDRNETTTRIRWWRMPLSPKDLAEMDQAMKIIADTWPPFLWSFHKNCLAEGFNENQAMALTIAELQSLQRRDGGRDWQMFDATIKINVSGGDLSALAFVLFFACTALATVAVIVMALKDAKADDLDDDESDDPTDDDQPTGSASAPPAGPTPAG